MPPCFIKVDLEFPAELHDKFAELIPAPESIIPEGSKVQKLARNLLPKEGYVCRNENPRLHVKLGVKLVKVHRGVKFEEKPWLKSYIDMNTKLRAAATNDADMYKLLNNAAFGKTCENLFNRADYRLVSSRKEALKLIAKPTFKDYTVYNERLAGIHQDPSSVTLDKPSYVGVIVLDLSKVYMYKFHYEMVKSRYKDRAKLLMTDTDSLFYRIETDYWYNDIREDVLTLYDTSAYPKDHPAGLPRVNKKVIGMMKDELKGRTITQFCGNRAKSYTFTVDSYPEMCGKKFCDGSCKEKECVGNDGKKCKGIKKSVVNKGLAIDHYKDCVLGGKGKIMEQTNFRSHKHEMFTERVRKVALSSVVVLDDGIRTLPIGHWRTKHPDLHDINIDAKKISEKGGCRI